MDFFIIGAQRSGTTLLRLLLNSHVDLAIPDEGTFWMPILRARKGSVTEAIPEHKLARYIEYIQNNDQFRAWKMEEIDFIQEALNKYEGINIGVLISLFYQAYSNSEGKRFCGDKTPSFFRMITLLAEVFPRAKFIHIVRDGRDAFLSMRKVVDHRDNVAVGALEWAYKISSIRRQLGKLDDSLWLEIRYEDLVAKPEEVVCRVCGFLGVAYDSKVLDFWKQSKEYISEHHSELIFQPIRNNRDKWMSELTSKEVEIFEFIARTTLEKYEYEVVNRERNAVTGMHALSSSLVGVPFRGLEVLYTIVRLDIAARLGRRTTAAGGKHYGF